jgi:hypothetical protein
MDTILSPTVVGLAALVAWLVVGVVLGRAIKYRNVAEGLDRAIALAGLIAAGITFYAFSLSQDSYFGWLTVLAAVMGLVVGFLGTTKPD